MTDATVGVLDVFLGVGLLSLAAFTLTARTRTTSAMAFLVLGALLSIVWVRLGTLDVALAEAALGSGILGAILVWLAVSSSPVSRRLRSTTTVGHRSPGRVHRVTEVGIALCAGVVTSLALVAAWTRISEALAQWDTHLSEALPGTGVEHDVTGVLLAFRAYDTLLESAVLLFAAVAVLALGRDGGLSDIRTATAPPHSTLAWVVRVSAPIVLLLGLWILFAGSTQSGGAFQSGSILCALLILMHTAGIPLGSFVKHWIRPLLVIGVIAFITAGAIGPVAGDPWLTWAPAWSFSIILTIEVLLTAGIAVGLFVLYLALASPSVTDTAAAADPSSDQGVTA